MSRVSLSRKHNLDHGKLKTELESLADDLVAKYGGDYRWQGDQLTYEYSGVKACVHCGEGEVKVDITFGMLMAMFKGQITRQIEEYLDRHLS